MAPKRASDWNSTFKVKARVFKYIKLKSFKHRSSGLNISVSRLDVPVLPLMPVFPHQDRCNRIANSVARLSDLRGDDPSSNISRHIFPVMIIKAEVGSCNLLYGDCGINWTGVISFQLTFPDKQIHVLPTGVNKREKRASIHGEGITLVALSCKTSEPTKPFQAIEFGSNVEMNQTVFLFDFRYGNASVTDGTVTYADSSHFMFDARPHNRYLYGALVFDICDKLVGIVYSHDGSPKAIQVDHVKRMLVEILPETQMTPRSLGRNRSLCDVASPPQPHAGEEEAALRQDVQACTMDAAADKTLDFSREQLDVVYAKISPFIVAIKLKSDDDVVGFVVHKTGNHYLIAMNSFVKNSEPKSVRYANKKVAPVEKAEHISIAITILFVKRVKGDPVLDKFDYADPTDNMCEKVVTFFPYRDGIAMFKGHIILNDFASRSELPQIDYTFTCPYATTHLLKDEEDMADTRQMTMGAPIFNLEGLLLGILNWSGTQYDVKYAMNSGHFNDQLPKTWKLKKSNSKDERKDESKHEDKDGQPLASGTQQSAAPPQTTQRAALSQTSRGPPEGGRGRGRSQASEASQNATSSQTTQGRGKGRGRGRGTSTSF